jgi:transcriptional regulator with XRE-family HTH domain
MLSMTSEVSDGTRTRRYGWPVSATAPDVPLGSLLREWRRRRHVSQLELGLDAGVSPRHLSFIETGRARPSREMVLRLAEQLEVPLRERNRLLLAAGYAPAYGERSLDGPELAGVREALQRVLDAHEPYPATIVDRTWHLVAANAAIGRFTALIAPELLAPPANVLRACLHPDGLAAHIGNLAEYRTHLLDRLRRQATVTGDPALHELLAELTAYPAPASPPGRRGTAADIAVPLVLRTPDGELTFVSTIATFGTATDVTLAELAIEAFLPADAATAGALRRPTLGP